MTKFILIDRISVACFVISLIVCLSHNLVIRKERNKVSASPTKKLLIMTGEWYPYVSNQLPQEGFTAELVRQACLAAGLQVVINFAPWPRCEAEVKHGKAFAAFPYSANQPRAEFTLFSHPIATSRSVFFYNKKNFPNFDYSTLDSLKLYLIGGVRGYFHEPLFQKAGLNVDYSDNEDDALKKLFYGRVDVMPLNEMVGWQSIIRLFPDQTDSFGATLTALNEAELTLMV